MGKTPLSRIAPLLAAALLLASVVPAVGQDAKPAQGWRPESASTRLGRIATEPGRGGVQISFQAGF